jgi:hypothetical protein
MTEIETKNSAHDKAFATLYTLDTDISRLKQGLRMITHHLSQQINYKAY